MVLAVRRKKVRRSYLRGFKIKLVAYRRVLCNRNNGAFPVFTLWTLNTGLTFLALFTLRTLNTGFAFFTCVTLVRLSVPVLPALPEDRGNLYRPERPEDLFRLADPSVP